MNRRNVIHISCALNLKWAENKAQLNTKPSRAQVNHKVDYENTGNNIPAESYKYRAISNKMGRQTIMKPSWNHACIKRIELLIEWPIFVRNALTFAIILQFLTHKEMYDETKPAKLCTLLHRKPVQCLEIYLHCTVHCSNIPESSNEIYYVYDYTENGLDGLEGWSL